jgi:hypothetical protein
VRPSSGWDLFASRIVVVVKSLVIGATRAPALIDGILAVDKRGQMTGGRRGSLDQQPDLWESGLRRRRRRSRFAAGVDGRAALEPVAQPPRPD